MLPILTTSLAHFSYKSMENALFELGIESGFNRGIRLIGLRTTWSQWQSRAALWAIDHHGLITRVFLKIEPIILSIILKSQAIMTPL